MYSIGQGLGTPFFYIFYMNLADAAVNLALLKTYGGSFIRQELLELIGRVVLGYFNYHAIPGNLDAPERFRGEVVCGWLHALRRRRERHHMTRACFGKFVDIWLPQPKILPP